MRNRHIMTMSASSFVERVTEVFQENSDGAAQREWAQGLLENSQALELLMNRMTNSGIGSIDINLVARAIETRCYELRDEYEEDRPQLFFLDMFRNRGLLSPIKRGLRGYISKVTDYSAGPVRFIGDKTDDWPTTGEAIENYSVREIKYFAKSVEYGILELWQAALEGKDIIGERVSRVYIDVDEFVDALIAQGAPMHGFHGFLNHPDIDVDAVPSTTGPNAPATDWPSKSPEEIIFDLQAIRRSTRVSSNYNEIADTLLLSDMRYEYIGATQIGTNGDFVLNRWIQQQNDSVVGGMKNFVPFVPYDEAGPGNTPICTAGTFDKRYVELPFMPATRIPTEYHGSKWKIGFIGAAGGVHIKRKGRFRTFTGI